MMWVGHEDPVLTVRLYRQARNRPRDPRVAAAMAEVPAKERKAPTPSARSMTGGGRSRRAGGAAAHRGRRRGLGRHDPQDPRRGWLR